MLRRIIARHYALVIEGERLLAAAAANPDPDPEPAHRRLFAAATLADLIAIETDDESWTAIARTLKGRIAHHYRTKSVQGVQPAAVRGDPGAELHALPQ